MAYVKHTEVTPDRQIRTLKRWQKRLPPGCRLKTVLGHPLYWWVEIPDGTSIANGRTAKKAVQYALVAPALIDAVAAVSSETEEYVPAWKRKQRAQREVRERWKGSWQ